MSSAPAKTKRVPIWKNGGKLTSANLIARYVEPQTSHVAARHRMTSVGKGNAGDAREASEDMVVLLFIDANTSRHRMKATPMPP